jgi:hypothetical protein
VKRFYSWHFAFPIRGARVAILVPDSLASVMIPYVVSFLGVYLLPALFGISPSSVLLGSLVFVIASPLFVWQVILVSVNGVAIWRTLLLVPYWVTRIPPDTEPELYESDDDVAASGVAYALRGDYMHIGNVWNARTLLELVRQCSASVRSNKSIERPREG